MDKWIILNLIITVMNIAATIINLIVTHRNLRLRKLRMNSSYGQRGMTAIDYRSAYPDSMVKK